MDTPKKGGGYGGMNNVSSDTYEKRIAALMRGDPEAVKPAEPDATVRVTSENYTKIYLQEKELQQKASKDTGPDYAAQRALEQKRATEAALAERRRADEFISRARALKDQISFWEKQIGSGRYDDAGIQANIQSLMSQLNGIPSGYR